MKRLLYIFAVATVVLSCSDKRLEEIDRRISEDEKALSELGERISTLEQTMLQINSDMRSLLILRGGVVISSVTGSDQAGWTLTLADGTTITIPPQGPKGNAPVFSLDEDGYWMVDYGQGAVYVLDQDGNKVSSIGVGQSGKDATSSPILSVSADGIWLVSYDNGETWEELLDTDGKPVPTTVEIGETLFQGVDVQGDSVTITIKTGEALTIPLVKHFLCSIEGTSGVEAFDPGQTRQFTVKMEGIAQLFVTCPDAWTVSLEGTVLSVTAPVQTKLYFDSEEYLAMYAVSISGHSTVASMKLTLNQ